MAILFASLCMSNAFAQLTDKETSLLASKVKTNYTEYGIEGAKVYQTRRHWTLVSIITVANDMKSPQQSRMAQIKATRTAAEFLRGATNASITVYEAFSDEATSLTEQSNSSVLQENQTVGSSTSTGANEHSLRAEKENMSDKIVQSSLANIDNMQPLLKFDGGDGETVYAYYMVISKHTAKQKR